MLSFLMIKIADKFWSCYCKKKKVIIHETWDPPYIIWVFMYFKFDKHILENDVNYNADIQYY